MSIPRAPYISASGALVTTGTTTTLALPSLLRFGEVPSVQFATLVISNPSGVGQTISSGSLQFNDTVGGVTSTITYTLSSVSIAPGANQTFTVALSNGYLQNPVVSVTFGGNPTAGTLNVLLVLSGKP
jgi:hypothetical protein